MAFEWMELSMAMKRTQEVHYETLIVSLVLVAGS